MKTAGVKVNIYRIESTLMELTMSVYKVIFLPVFFRPCTSSGNSCIAKTENIMKRY